MIYKYPLEYEVEPTSVDKGVHWVTLKLKNIGRVVLTKLDVQLHSIDTYNLSINWEGVYFSELYPDEQKEIVARVTVKGSTNIYLSIYGYKGDDRFYWDSGYIHITVKDEKAKFDRFFVLSSPYTSIGKALEIEATIKGLQKSEGLRVEFWTDTPSGRYEELATITTGKIDKGDETSFVASITPKETGLYTVYAYLYDEWRRIDLKTDTIYVRV